MLYDFHPYHNIKLIRIALIPEISLIHGVKRCDIKTSFLEFPGQSS
jgi:hypothetical protein